MSIVSLFLFVPLLFCMSTFPSRGYMSLSFLFITTVKQGWYVDILACQVRLAFPSGRIMLPLRSLRPNGRILRLECCAW